MPSILVSHPCKQYTHHLVYSLQEAGYLNKFITAFWYKPESFPFYIVNHLPETLRKTLKSELNKKSYNKILNQNVEQFPYIEVLRESIERITRLGINENFMYFRNRVHDYYVSLRLDHYKPDIVIGYETSSLKTFRAAKSRGIITILDLAQVHYRFLDDINNKHPQINILHNDKELLKRVNKYKQDELELADYFFVLSDYAKNSLTENGINKSKIYKINIGYDKNVFTPKNDYVNRDKFRILFAGSITRRKGIQNLLEAVSKLKKDDIELTMVGNMGDAHDLLKRYRGLYRHISFRDQNELAEFYREADIFVFPSILDSWAMVVVEAMACGTPVIISNNTGSKELVKNGINGFIIETGDTGELMDKINYFYNNRELIPAFGKRATESVSNYGWENYYKNTIKTINQINSKQNKN